MATPSPYVRGGLAGCPGSGKGGRTEFKLSWAGLFSPFFLAPRGGLFPSWGWTARSFMPVRPDATAASLPWLLSHNNEKYRTYFSVPAGCPPPSGHGICDAATRGCHPQPQDLHPQAKAQAVPPPPLSRPRPLHFLLPPPTAAGLPTDLAQVCQLMGAQRTGSRHGLPRTRDVTYCEEAESMGAGLRSTRSPHCA